MLLDIFIGVPMIIFTVLGVRDGVVRKLVSIAVIILALFLGQMFMKDMGNVLVDKLGTSKQNAPMHGYLVIFFGLFILQAVIYKFVAKSYKLGGVADRIAGGTFGFIQGAIFMSSILFILAMNGFPGKETRRDTRFYKGIVNIAPQILDAVDAVKDVDIKKSLDLDAKPINPKEQK